MPTVRREHDSFFPILVAFVACAIINLAFVPSRDFAALYSLPVLVASLLVPPVGVVLTALFAFAIDVADLLWERDSVGAWLIGLTTFLIVGGVSVLVSAQRREIHRRAGDAEHLAEELRAVSDQLRTIIQASPLAIIALDASDRITLWNPGAARIFGWSEDEVSGQALPASLRQLASSLREGLTVPASGNAAESSQNMACARRNGSYVDVTAHAARLARGGEVGLVVVAEDTSQARAAERAIRQAAEAETAHRVAQARLDGVRLAARSTAHLVNNSLAEAVGYLDLLSLQNRLRPEASTMVARAQQSIDAATGQIVRLQQVVRVETWETPVGPALDLERSA